MIIDPGCVMIVCVVSGWLVCGVECVLWLGDGWYSNDIIMISWWSITCLIPAPLLISARIYGFLVSLPPHQGWLDQALIRQHNKWHKIQELRLLMTSSPLSRDACCEMSEPHYLWSPRNCWWCRCWWRGRGPGWVQGYDVLMSSVIFLYTGVIHHVTSSPAPHSSSPQRTLIRQT